MDIETQLERAPILLAERVGMLGQYVRDQSTGIVGRVNAVCFNAHERAQFQLKRYGVDQNGHPYPLLWVYVGDTVPATYDEARA